MVLSEGPPWRLDVPPPPAHFMRFLDHLSMARKLWGSTLFITLAMLGVAVATQRLSVGAVDKALEWPRSSCR